MELGTCIGLRLVCHCLHLCRHRSFLQGQYLNIRFFHFVSDLCWHFYLHYLVWLAVGCRLFR